MNMLEKIQPQLEYLGKSERKIAEVILASPDNTIHSNIAALALEASVNEPMVSRLCRSMDTRGFPGFKLHLTQNLANGTPYISRNVNGDNSVELYTGEIFESAMATLDHVRHSLDKFAISRAVDLFAQAKKVTFLGSGSLAAAAYDAMDKFFRFNVPAACSDDIVLQRMSCMNRSDEDAVVLISHTGGTKSPVELAQLTRENDAAVIALTSVGTPLIREATLAITLDVSEDTNTYISMVSRLAQLTVIDALATGFTLRRGTKFRGNLKRVKEALEESRFDKQLLSSSDDR